MKMLAVLMLATLIAGCAAQKVWVKAGASQQEFTTDKYNCEKDARQSGYFGTGLVGAINMSNFFNNCMNAHGYYLQQQQSVQSVASVQAQMPPINKSQSPSDRFGHYDDTALCHFATSYDGGSWEPNPPGADAAIVAQQRGLTLADCKRLGSFENPNATTASEASTATAETSAAVVDHRAAKADGSTKGLRVAMQKQGGTYVVPVLINGTITLDFTVDSGAADVSVPADVVLTLMRAGTIQASDFLGKKTYTLADGSTMPSSTFRIRSLKVGSKTVENATGTIASVKGDLLLGESFLEQFKAWSIDNTTHDLVLQ